MEREKVLLVKKSSCIGLMFSSPVASLWWRERKFRRVVIQILLLGQETVWVCSKLPGKQPSNRTGLSAKLSRKSESVKSCAERCTIIYCCCLWSEKRRRRRVERENEDEGKTRGWSGEKRGRGKSFWSTLFDYIPPVPWFACWSLGSCDETNLLLLSSFFGNNFISYASHSNHAAIIFDADLSTHFLFFLFSLLLTKSCSHPPVSFFGFAATCLLDALPWN